MVVASVFAVVRLARQNSGVARPFDKKAEEQYTQSL
jgi:hypothetical protein